MGKWRQSRRASRRTVAGVKGELVVDDVRRKVQEKIGRWERVTMASPPEWQFLGPRPVIEDEESLTRCSW